MLFHQIQRFMLRCLKKHAKLAKHLHQVYRPFQVHVLSFNSVETWQTFSSVLKHTVMCLSIGHLKQLIFHLLQMEN